MDRYWRHQLSGEVYAVKISNGDVVAVVGPLHHSEYGDLRADSLGDYNYTSEDVDWIVEHNGEFRDVTKCKGGANESGIRSV